MTATLSPEIEPGTVSWLDIQMTIPCNCNTAMVTFWVTPLDPTGVSEGNEQNINVFPNPTSDFVTVGAEGLQKVEVIDLMGRVVKSVSAISNTLRLDFESLSNGLYYLSVRTEDGIIIRPIVKK